ncbi:RHS repeat-associated core domain-containing protein [Mucilaginibacter sp.]
MLATYDNQGNAINWREQSLYGSSRLGLWKPDYALTSATVDQASKAFNTAGSRQYELTNHLGNVLATVSDRRLQDGSTSGVPNYKPDVLTATDYYPFGMAMKGRSTGNAYRYGFNGKENDKDISDGAQDYGMRIYDGRVGRFASIDPLSLKYPWYTPYQFAGNSPIANTDLDGEEEWHYTMSLDKQGKTALKQTAYITDNHHSFLGFEWDTQIQTQRYVVTYGKNTYYIGFASNIGRSNNWKMAQFRQFLKSPDAQKFVNTFDDAQTEQQNAFTSDMQIAAVASLSVYENIKLSTKVRLTPNSETEAGSSNPKFDVKDINKVNGNTNCVNCALATDNYLKGRPTSALNSQPTQLSVIEQEYNAKFTHGLSIEQVKGMVGQKGQMGIVFGNRGIGRVGHVFNVINQNGQINFIDGQTGQGANLSGYKNFSFIPTVNP